MLFVVAWAMGSSNATNRPVFDVRGGGQNATCVGVLTPNYTTAVMDCVPCIGHLTVSHNGYKWCETEEDAAAVLGYEDGVALQNASDGGTEWSHKHCGYRARYNATSDICTCAEKFERVEVEGHGVDSTINTLRAQNAELETWRHTNTNYNVPEYNVSFVHGSYYRCEPIGMPCTTDDQCEDYYGQQCLQDTCSCNETHVKQLVQHNEQDIFVAFACRVKPTCTQCPTSLNLSDTTNPYCVHTAPHDFDSAGHRDHWAPHAIVAYKGVDDPVAMECSCNFGHRMNTTWLELGINFTDTADSVCTEVDMCDQASDFDTALELVPTCGGSPTFRSAETNMVVNNIQNCTDRPGVEFQWSFEHTSTQNGLVLRDQPGFGWMERGRRGYVCNCAAGYKGVDCTECAEGYHMVLSTNYTGSRHITNKTELPTGYEYECVPTDECQPIADQVNCSAIDAAADYNAHTGKYEGECVYEDRDPLRLVHNVYGCARSGPAHRPATCIRSEKDLTWVGDRKGHGKPCNGGHCIDNANGFECDCGDTLSGDNCETFEKCPEGASTCDADNKGECKCNDADTIEGCSDWSNNLFFDCDCEDGYENVPLWVDGVLTLYNGSTVYTCADTDECVTSETSYGWQVNMTNECGVTDARIIEHTHANGTMVGGALNPVDLNLSHWARCVNTAGSFYCCEDQTCGPTVAPTTGSTVAGATIPPAAGQTAGPTSAPSSRAPTVAGATIPPSSRAPTDEDPLSPAPDVGSDGSDGVIVGVATTAAFCVVLCMLLIIAHRRKRWPFAQPGIVNPPEIFASFL